MRGKQDDPITTRPRHGVTGPAFATLDELRRASAPSDGGPARHDDHALPEGFRLDEFEIVRKIGHGGFSVVYLAWDHSLERQVALKEYMPAAIATRSEFVRIGPRSDRDRETYEAGLRSFVNEGRLLAQFDLLALVKVYRFWQANGTAYMVMPFYQGRTVREAVRAMPSPPGQDWLVDLVLPLMDVLDVMHAARCYHRDIAPDNILLLAESDAVLLLDFGAARRVVGDMTQALTVVLKPGYAPIEQYGDSPEMNQGPWTDVYALAAVLYWAISGKPPAMAITRLVKDTMVSAAEVGQGRYASQFLQAIDRALALRPEGRTPSIAAFRDDLLRGGSLPASKGSSTGAASSPLDDPEETRIRPTRIGTPAASSGHASGPSVVRSRRGWLIGVATASVVVVGAVVAWRMLSPVARQPADVAAVRPAPVPPIVRDGPSPTSPVVDASPAGPASVVASPSPSLSTLPAAIAALRTRSDPSIAVRIAPDPAAFDPSVASQRRVVVRSATPGFVSLFAADDSGRLVLLGQDPAGATAASPVERTFDVGRWTASLSARGPWELIAVVSRVPRAFASGDWQDRDGIRVRSGQGAASEEAWWGRPVCAPREANCPTAYGLASIAIVVGASSPTRSDERPAPPARRATGPSTPVARPPPTECAKLMERISVGETPSVDQINRCR